MVKTPQFLLIVITIIILDRILKELALAFLDQTVVLIPGLLFLTLVYNNGVAFGMLDQWPIVIEIITVLIILGTLYALPKIEKQFTWPMALIIGGAAGNLIDRLRFDFGVIDYLHLRWFSIFNLADVAISAGVVWILWIVWRDGKSESKVKSRK